MKIRATVKFGRNEKQQRLAKDLIACEVKNGCISHKEDGSVAIYGEVFSGREDLAIHALNLLESYSEQCEYHIDDNYHSYRNLR